MVGCREGFLVDELSPAQGVRPGGPFSGVRGVPFHVTVNVTTTAIEPQQHPVVWDLPLSADPEGPPLISRTARFGQEAISAF